MADVRDTPAQPLATICRNLPGFIRDGSACGLTEGRRRHREETEIHMATATALKSSSPKQLPLPNSDFYQFAETLSADEQAISKRCVHSWRPRSNPLSTSIGSKTLFCSSCSPPLRSSTSAASATMGTAAPVGVNCWSALLAWKWRGSTSQSQPSSASTTTSRWVRSRGNGILVDYSVARFFADAEALYSYEGTYQMQHLIVGKAVTGFSAFV